VRHHGLNGALSPCAEIWAHGTSKVALFGNREVNGSDEVSLE
jgi:hypothetical protein